MRLLVQLGLLCGLFGTATACASSAQRTGHMAGETAAPLQDDALRTLLSDAYATPPVAAGIIMSHPPGEIFRANGVYERIVGRTSLEGTFEIRASAACVRGPDFAPQCRRVVANSDGTYTFIDIADGASTVMTVTPLGTANDGSRPFLGSDALRTLLSDVSVTDTRTAWGDDGPSEVFRANGIYQRIGGRGVSNEALYEIRGDTVCVRGDGAPRCRRVRANGDGTWTFVNTADGTSGIMVITQLR